MRHCASLSRLWTRRARGRIPRGPNSAHARRLRTSSAARPSTRRGPEIITFRCRSFGIRYASETTSRPRHRACLQDPIEPRPQSACSKRGSSNSAPILAYGALRGATHNGEKSRAVGDTSTCNCPLGNRPEPPSSAAGKPGAGEVLIDRNSSIVTTAHTPAKSASKAIGDLDSVEWDLPPKPKWMRWETHIRYEERFDHHETVLDYGCAELVAKLAGLKNPLRSRRGLKLAKRFRLCSYIAPARSTATRA